MGFEPLSHDGPSLPNPVAPASDNAALTGRADARLVIRECCLRSMLRLAGGMRDEVGNSARHAGSDQR